MMSAQVPVPTVAPVTENEALRVVSDPFQS